MAFAFFAGCAVIHAQSAVERGVKYGDAFIAGLATAPFPAPARDTGHSYRGNFFPREKHYTDSSVLFFIPANYRPQERVNIVVYFHGWYNNIDSACAQFSLIEQFAASGRNAIFLFPEGPKNAPDSHGGKLEDSSAFRAFISEALNVLKRKGKIDSPVAGDITIAGHSGAYRVMARIAARGGMEENLREIILFDGLYADMEKFIGWIDRGGERFINIFTESGGTKEESEMMMDSLRAKKIPFLFCREEEMTPDCLDGYRLQFYYTTNGHNSVIAEKEQFRRFLSTGAVSRRSQLESGK